MSVLKLFQSGGRQLQAESLSLTRYIAIALHECCLIFAFLYCTNPASSMFQSCNQALVCGSAASLRLILKRRSPLIESNVFLRLYSRASPARSRVPFRPTIDFPSRFQFACFAGNRTSSRSQTAGQLNIVSTKFSEPDIGQLPKLRNTRFNPELKRGKINGYIVWNFQLWYFEIVWNYVGYRFWLNFLIIVEAKWI